FFAKRHDPVVALGVEFDQPLAESLADHAIADHHDRLSCRRIARGCAHLNVHFPNRINSRSDANRKPQEEAPTSSIAGCWPREEIAIDSRAALSASLLKVTAKLRNEQPVATAT